MNNTKQKFDVIESKTVLASATELLWSYKVPPNAILKITKFGNTLKEPDAWGYVFWTIKRNGVPAEAPYDAIYDQLGFGAMLKDVNIDEFHGGDLVEVYTTNNYIDFTGVGLLMVVEVY